MPTISEQDFEIDPDRIPTRKLTPVSGTPVGGTPARPDPRKVETLPELTIPETPYSAAGMRLTLWLEKTGLSQQALANVLGVSRPAVSQWCAGVCRPEAIRAATIAEAGGPEPWRWQTPEEIEHQRALAFRLYSALHTPSR